MSTHRPFQLNHGSIEHTFLVPHSLYANYSQLKDEFAKTLPQPTEGFAGDDEPASPVELYGKFLGFISQQQQPSQDEVLRHAIRDFESTFLQDTDDIHSFAVKILQDETYPTTQSKIKNLVKNYYQSVQNIPRTESNLLYHAAKKTAK